MRPKLTPSVYAMALTASLVSAAYAGHIFNDNGTTSGSITIDYNPDPAFVNTEVGLMTPNGAVERSGEGASNGTTTLEGDITIISGYDYRDNTTDFTGSHGVYAAGEYGDPENPAQITDSNIILRTLGTTDKIKIDTYGRGTAGVFNKVAGSKITLDASTSDHAIEITHHNAGTGYGILTDKGDVDVIGSLKINSQSAAGISGIISQNGSMVRVSGAQTDISVINTAGPGRSYGILGRSGDVVVNSGLININVSSDSANGVIAGQGAAGSVTINGTTNIQVSGTTSMGIRTEYEGGKVTMSGGPVTISATGSQARGIWNVGGEVILNTRTDITVTHDGNGEAAGIQANNNTGAITAKDAVTIKATGAGAYGVYSINSAITFDSTLSVESHANAVLVKDGGTIYLSGASKLSSTAGSSLYAAGTGSIIGNGTYTFSGNLRAYNDGALIDLTMQNGSDFTGHASMGGNGTQTINIALESNSLWAVTQNSGITSLTLDGTSWLAFNLLDSGTMTFANITAASIALADGAVLQLLGVNSADFDGTSRALTTFTANLLNAGALTANDIKLVTADNYELAYTNNNDGTFTVTGVTANQLFIPEPATATLGLLGLASLLARRRKA